MRIRAAAAALLLAACPAAAAPGDRQFAVVTDHNPAAVLRAVRAGSDFVRGGRGRQFRVVLAAAGAIAAIPGASTIGREVVALKRGAPGLQIYACKETIDAIQKANRRRIPVLPGVTVGSCTGLRNKMMVSGWQVAPGI